MTTMDDDDVRELLRRLDDEFAGKASAALTEARGVAARQRAEPDEIRRAELHAEHWRLMGLFDGFHAAGQVVRGQLHVLTIEARLEAGEIIELGEVFNVEGR